MNPAGKLVSSQQLVEKICELVLLWRGRKYEQLIGTLCLALLGLLAYVGKEKDIPLIGDRRALVLGLLIVLVILCISFVVWRLGRLRFPSQETTPPKLLPSAVRGPLPFVETDGELFLRLGRKRLLQDLLTLVLNEETPVVVVSGESGAGKTSLLRAGLVYVLREQYARTCVYWDARTVEVESSLLRAIQSTLGGRDKIKSLRDLYLDDPTGSRLVVIMDQFEQLNPNKIEHKRLFELISEAARRAPPHPVTWVVSFKREFGADWYEFQSDNKLTFAHIFGEAVLCRSSDGGHGDPRRGRRNQF